MRIEVERIRIRRSLRSRRGQGRSPLCPVSGGPDRLDEESRVYAILYGEASRPGQRERDSDEDEGEALGQDAFDRLDADEEKGSL